jgi:hypothetical protein
LKINPRSTSRAQIPAPIHIPKKAVILSAKNLDVILSDPERSDGESKNLRLLFVALKGHGFSHAIKQW